MYLYFILESVRVMNMQSDHEHDFIQVYEAAIAELENAADNRLSQHKAVLALARAGALDFAISEYKKYGLNDVRNNEDIMALGARLSKDLYLRSKGKEALSHAQDAAHKYEDAFKSTQGYYSGINAATMALMADMPSEMIVDRVHNILEQLPATENLSPEERYFIQATRAECFLLLGERSKAEELLKKAIAFDPLNYSAHASTLKQFRLILDKRRQDQHWLFSYQPPRSIHYAGHIWSFTEHMPDNFSVQLSDMIQRHDIGFGYGALAAGADIVIAEALLLEGAELNVFLPSSIDSFIENSVRPFGDAWVPRFRTCLAKAKSCTSLADTGEGVDLDQNILSARMAMGQAILRSEHLNVSPCQILIREPNRVGSLTTHHYEDWKAAGHEQLSILMNNDVQLSKARKIEPKALTVLVKSSDQQDIQKFPSFISAMSAIGDYPRDETVMLGLHFDVLGAINGLEAIMNGSLEGTILVTEEIACYVALRYRQDYKITFAGTVLDNDGRGVRTYTVC